MVVSGSLLTELLVIIPLMLTLVVVVAVLLLLHRDTLPLKLVELDNAGPVVTVLVVVLAIPASDDPSTLSAAVV